MFWIPVPMGVYKTEHTTTLGPLGDKRHWPHGSTHTVPGGGPGINVPNPSDVNVTVPVGLDAPDIAVSVTVAAQVVDWPASIGLEAHDTLVLVESAVTV